MLVCLSLPSRRKSLILPVNVEVLVLIEYSKVQRCSSVGRQQAMADCPVIGKIDILLYGRNRTLQITHRGSYFESGDNSGLIDGSFWVKAMLRVQQAGHSLFRRRPVNSVVSGENVKASGAIFELETPLSCLDIPLNVPDQSIGMSSRPTPSCRPAGALINRYHLDVSSKQVTARPQRILHERFG